MTNGVYGKMPERRQRWIDQLGSVAAEWGAVVPDDPGVGELADIFERRVGVLDTPAETVELLADAVESMRAAARLGGLLPEVVLWHLRHAVEQQRSASALTRPVRAAL